MNERIQKLIEQATVRGEEYLPGNDGHPTPTVYFDKEKFAELIVRECCLVLEQTQTALDRHKWPTPSECGIYIKEHFGVEK